VFTRLAIITNATKGQITVAWNAVLSTLLAFDITPLTPQQIGALGVLGNALLGLWIAVTYKWSALRIPDAAVEPPTT